MEELVLRRHLGRAFAGMQRDQLCAALGTPDDWMDDAKRPGVATALIWRYGLFEVHFVGDLAMSLFTDYLNELDAGPGRTVEPWNIAPTWQRTIGATRERLAQQRVDYVVGQDSLKQPVLRMTNGADLLFDNSDAAPSQRCTRSAFRCVISPAHSAFHEADPRQREGLFLRLGMQPSHDTKQLRLVPAQRQKLPASVGPAAHALYEVVRLTLRFAIN